MDPNPGFKSKYCYFHQFFCRDLPDRLTKMDRRKAPSRTKKTVRKTTGMISPSLSMSLHQNQLQSPSYSLVQSENNGGIIYEESLSSITPSIFNESVDSNDLLSNSCESSDMDLLDSLFLFEETFGENSSSSSSSSSSAFSPSLDNTTVNVNHTI